MFFLVATMLGLFGSEVIPSIVRMDALNAFNYVSIISLFDVINILQGGSTYVWKFAILIAAGIILYIAGAKKFETKLNFGKIILLNLGAFIVMFAMSGLCFFASCWFNRSKRSMAIGGGLNMFFLVATMLGLFGSEVIPSIVRMDALNAFNYVSIISLFDVINILQGGTTYVWKFAILIAAGIILYFVGAKKFETKDLPL